MLLCTEISHSFLCSYEKGRESVCMCKCDICTNYKFKILYLGHCRLQYWVGGTEIYYCTLLWVMIFK